MLTPQRQRKFAAIQKQLVTIPGVSAVVRDDFDSTGMNVFIQLAVKTTGSNRKPREFVGKIRLIKNQIKGIFGKNKIHFAFTDQPAMTYSWSPAAPGIPGEKVKEGYDGDSIKLDVGI